MLGNSWTTAIIGITVIDLVSSVSAGLSCAGLREMMYRLGSIGVCFRLLLLLFLASLACAYEDLDSSSLRQVTEQFTGRLSLNSEDELNHFVHFNKTRIPGSIEALQVQSYILNHFESLNQDLEVKWEFELDNFVEKAYNFTNIVATREPKLRSSRTKYLVFAAHYDTLVEPEGFIGAIDSAISCSILLDMAQMISKPTDKYFTDIAYDMELGVKFIFFDGEEAFEQWSATDSIYGARHLFAKWDQEAKIKNIELFVLLDLLGSPDSNHVPSYFAKSHEQYNELALLENRLSRSFPQIFGSYQQKFLDIPRDDFVRPRVVMEDDHIPFLRAGVPILHLIPDSFPKQWHTMYDNFDNVDLGAVKRWNLLLSAYILEYLEIIDPFIDS